MPNKLAKSTLPQLSREARAVRDTCAAAAALKMTDPDGSYTNEVPNTLEVRQERIERIVPGNRNDVYEALDKLSLSSATNLKSPEASSSKRTKTSKSKSLRTRKQRPSNSPVQTIETQEDTPSVSSIYLSPSPDLTESTDVSEGTTPISNPPTPHRVRKIRHLSQLDQRVQQQHGTSPPGYRRQRSIRELLEQDVTETSDASVPLSAPPLYETSEDSDSSSRSSERQRVSHANRKPSVQKQNRTSQTKAKDSIMTDVTPSTAPVPTRRTQSPSSSSGVVQFSPVKPMPLVPSLPLRVTPSLLPQHRDVFPLVLPMGPTGMVLSGDNPPVIKRVKQSSPLAGIVDPGYFVLGLHVPGGSSRSIKNLDGVYDQDDAKLDGQIFSDISSKELQYALRYSAKKAMRTLWISRKRTPSLSGSVPASSLLRQRRGLCSIFSVTLTKSLVSIPRGDSGISLLGNPPLIISIEASSPLDGVLVPAEHYVLGMYRPKLGVHHRGFSSDQLSALLESTSRESGRVLVVTSDPNDLPTKESESDSSLNSKTSLEKSDSGSFWSSGVLARANSETEVASVQVTKSAPDDDPVYFTTSSSTPEEASSLSHSKKDSAHHIIVKKRWETKRTFALPRPYPVISFHGKAMDWSIANRIQYGLNEIPSKVGAPVVKQEKQNGDTSWQYSAVLSHEFGMHHEDDAMVAILDALGSMGWELQCALVDHQFKASSRRGFRHEKLIFTSSGK
jgi:hypothetical protein